MNNENMIRAEPQDYCILCGSKSLKLYTQLTDIVFAIASGEWELSQCQNLNCHLAWLNPMPKTEDIGKAYKGYYTHEEIRNKNSNILTEVYNNIKNGYLASRYGYKNEKVALLYKFLGNLIYLFPIRRQRLDYPLNLVSPLPKGKLLEIGCGSGNHLSILRDFGWDAKGIDFDAKAVEKAVARKLDVVCGDLLSQEYPENEFDVIIMHHVIEHLPDPIAVVRECNKLLKRGGRLMVITPNFDSLGRRVYNQFWRGLEVPRHLYIYNRHSLLELVSLSYFKSVKIETLPIRGMYILNRSSELKRKSRVFRWLFYPCNYIIFLIENIADRVLRLSLAEELVLIAVK